MVPTSHRPVNTILLTRRAKRDDIVDIRLIFCMHINDTVPLGEHLNLKYIDDGVDVRERSY